MAAKLVLRNLLILIKEFALPQGLSNDLSFDSSEPAFDRCDSYHIAGARRPGQLSLVAKRFNFFLVKTIVMALTFVIAGLGFANKAYAQPTVQATNVTFSSVTSTGATINWTVGNGAHEEVFVLQGSTGSPSPVNGTIYTANSIFKSGSQIGTSGWYCVSNTNPPTASVTITGLTASTTYRVMVVDFNSNSSPLYLTTTNATDPANFTTLATPAISETGSLAAFSTTYGTASASQNFSVSGSNLTANLVVTPPTGFEVSTNNSTFTSTVSLTPSGGTVASTTVYIRLAAATAAGTFSGNTVLSSTGATSVNVAVPSSTVSPAPLTLTATGPTKTYGTALTTGTSSTNFTATGMVLGQTVTSVTLTPNAAGLSATTPAGSAYTVTPSAPTGGGGFLASNYTITANVYNGTVAAKALSITASAQSKVYGNTLTSGSSTTGFTSSGLVGSETIGSVTLTYGAGAAATDPVGTNAGSIVPSAATGGTFNPSNYTITYNSGTLTVTTLALTVTGITANNKVYDGTTSATISGTAALNGVVNGDNVTLVTGSVTSVFTSSTVGNGKTVNVNGYSITQPASNYTLVQPTALTANITPAPLTVTANDGPKTYGTSLTTLTGQTTFTSSGLVNGQTIGSVTLNYGAGGAATASVAGSPYNTITPSAATGGTFTASNYTITYVAGNLTVNPKALSVTASAQTKTYGNTLTSGSSTTNFTSSGLANSETIGSVTLTYGSGSAPTDPVASYPGSIVPSAATPGTFDPNNYTITYNAGTLTVVGIPLNVINITANDKVYDGTTAATISGTPALSGVVSGDEANVTLVTGSVTSVFTSASAGSNKTVNVNGYSITGPSAPNYALVQPTALTANITGAPLTLTATGPLKAYGVALTTGTSPTNFTATGMIGSETVTSVTLTPDAAGQSATTPVGSAYVVTPSLPTGGGGFLASNYIITPVAYNGTVTAPTISYTGTPYTFIRFTGITTVNPTTSGGSPTYAISPSLNANTGLTFSTTNGSISGTPTINNGPTTYTVTATYTGGVTATATLSVTVVSSVSLTYTGSPFTYNYGVAITPLTPGGSGTPSSYTVSPALPTGLSLNGTTGVISGTPTQVVAATNYVVTSHYTGTTNTATATLNIKVNAPTLTYTGSPFTYVAGTQIASLSPSGSSGATGYTVSPSLPAGLILDPNTGIISGTPTTATGAANYTVTATYTGGATAQATVNITVNSPTLSYAGSPFTYVISTTITPANPTFTGNPTGFSGTLPDGLVLNTSTGQITGAPTTLSSATIYTITASYAAGITATANVSIAVVNPTLTITANNKTMVYGASVPVLDVSYSGFINGDSPSSLTTPPTITTTGTSTSNVGSYPITASGVVAPSYYTVVYVGGTLSITPAPVTINGLVANSKPYDRTNTATFASGSTLSGVLVADQPNVTLVPSGTFATANAGNNIAVTSTSTLTGSAAANYSLTQPTGLTANITQVPLTITANDVTKTYSATLTSGSSTAFTSVGLVSPETIGSVTMTYGTGAASTAPVGNYPGQATPSAATGGTFTASNYSITYVSGAINVINPTITYPRAVYTLLRNVAITTITPTITGSPTAASGLISPSLNTNTGLTFNTTTGAISGTPSVTSGLTSYLVTFSYTGGTTAQTNVSVQVVTAVSLSYAGTPFTFSYGNAITSISPTVTGTPISYSVSPALPAGLSLNTTTGVISGTPTAVVAATNYTVTATYYNTSTTATINIKVNAPTLSYTGSPFTYYTGTPISSLSPTISAAPNNYSVSPALPAGLSLDPSTGIISGTPTTVTAAGNYVVSANYNGGVTAQATLNMQVLAPTLSYAGTPFTFTLNTAITPASPTVTGTPTSYSVSPALPTALSIDPATGILSGTPSGTSAAANYTVTANYAGGVTAQATISIAVNNPTLTITADNQTMTYGSTVPNLTISYSGFINGDTPASLTTPPSISTTATSSSPLGSYPINISGAVAPAYYNIVYVQGSLTVSPIQLTITGMTASDKVYNKNTTASLSGGTLVGVLPADQGNVTLNQTGTFATATAGNNIAVTSTSTITGSAASNYTLVQPTGLTANITKKPLTIPTSGLTVTTKTYNQTTAAQTTGSLSSTLGLSNGVISGDVVALGGTLTNPTGVFSDANAGTGKTVTITSATLSGPQAVDYSINITLLGNINPAPLGLASPAGVNKAYDGTTAATITGILTGVISGDQVTYSGVGNFATASVGTGIVITPNITISGAQATNYSFTQPTGLSANITQAPLTIIANNQTKPYGTTFTFVGTEFTFVNVNNTGNTGTLYASDNIASVNFTSTGAAATATVAGSPYSIVPSGASGTGLTNYLISYTNGSMTVTPATLTIAPAVTKTYGTQLTTGAGSTFFTSTGLANGQTIGSITMTYGTGAAANAPVSGSPYVNQATPSLATGGTFTPANYTIVYNKGDIVITQAQLNITATGPPKVYGQALTAGTSSTYFTYSGTVNSETVTSVTLTPDNNGLSTTVAAGTPYTVTPSLATGGGGFLEANYSVNYVPFNGITGQAPVTITGVTASDKTYDGSATATLSGGILTGIVSGDDIAFAAGTGAFNDASAGINKPVTASGYALTGTAAGNYVLSAQPTVPNATIFPANSVTITGVTAGDKTYDGNAVASLSGGSISGVLPADAANVSFSAGSGAFSDASAGQNKTVTASGYVLTGSAAGNYTLAAQPTVPNANINQADVTITGVTASDKTYDGNATATLSGGSVSGVIPADASNVSFTAGTGAFNDPSAGTNKPVTASGYTLTGTAAGNYNLSIQPIIPNATIFPANTVTITGVTANDKAYDGNATATLSGGSVSGVLAADAANVSFTAGTGAFNDANAGQNKIVTASGYVLTGSAAGNYQLTQPTVPNANINQVDVIITGVTASDKTYDGNAVATLSGGSVSGVLPADAANVSFTAGTGAFSDASAGQNKTVTASGYVLTGTAAGNYTLSTQPTVPNANINQADVTITGVTASDKTYDGNAVATLSGGSVSGVLADDAANVSFSAGSGAFNDASAGINKPVTASGYVLTGTAAGNYILSAQPTVPNATIFPANAVTITGVIASDKTYDGNAVATLSGGTVTGVLPADAANVSFTAGTGAFSDASAGQNKTVTASGYVLTGSAAGNYTLEAQPAIPNANINQADVTITGVTASDKNYDGNATATLSGGSVSGVISDDAANVSFTPGLGAFIDANAGINKPVTATGYVLTGTAAGNYNLTGQPTVPNATIFPANTVIITGVTASDKTYDGNATATLSGGTVTGVLPFDAANVSFNAGSGAFSDASAGQNKTVTASGYFLTGTAAGNYMLSAQPTVPNANINQLDVTITGVTASDKNYDGNATATLSGGSVSGVLPDDAANVSFNAGSGAFNDASAGTNKPVTASGYTLTGTAAGNYNLTAQPIVPNATIFPANAVTITGVTASDKTYDGNAVATLSGGSVSGVLAADAANVSFTAGTGAFSDASAGQNKTVTASGYVLTGTAAGNYTLSTQPTVPNANINPVNITVTADAKTKVFGDADPSLTYQVSGNLVGSDAFTGALTRATGEDVGLHAITQGTLALTSNYQITFTGANLNITTRDLTITAKNSSKTYGASQTFAGTEFNTSGLQFGNTIASVTLTSAGADPSAAIGSYDIVPSDPIGSVGTNLANYHILYANGTDVVGTAQLTIKANNDTKVYGATQTFLGTEFTTTGLLNHDAINTVTLTSGGTDPLAPVNNYPIVPTNPVAAQGTDLSNYTISYVNGVDAVGQATLTVKADDKTIFYGDPLPPLTATYTGFVNNETASTLTPAASLSTTATASSGPGQYIITASGAVDNNYAYNYESGLLTINAVPITFNPITAQTYGNVDFDPGATSSAGITYTSSNTNVATIVSNKVHIKAVGTTLITANNGSSTQSQSLVINPAPLTVTADNQSKAYGATNPALTVSYSGFVNGDTQASLTTPATASTTATAASPVGTYPINVTGAAVDPNYTFSYVAGTLTVGKATLTVTADNSTKAYGTANPNFTVSYNGFLNGDTKNSLTTQASVSTSATASSPVGNYDLVPGGAVSSNYNFTYVNGVLNVTPVALLITANNASKAYGAGIPPFTASYSGFVNGDTQASLATPPTMTTTATSSSPIGTYPITASGAVDPNYTISYAPGTLTVNQANLVITPNSISKVYGATIPTLTASYSGFTNGDTPASLSPQPTLSTTATAGSPIGTYLITATGAANPNYNITYNTGNLTVTPATLTITANDQSKTYGSSNPTLTASYNGFVNGDTRNSLTTRPTITTTATTTSPAGAYPITVSGAVDPNYTFTYVPGTLTINPAVLTVTANDQSKIYGANNPTLSVIYSGFVNGDTKSSLTTPATASTTATAASPVGTYPITASGAVDPNYSFVYFAGTLTVNQATLTIAANTLAKSYGSPNPTLTASYSGFVNGDTQASLIAQPTIATTAVTGSPVGNYPITASGAYSPNYTINYLQGTMIVTQVALFISADNQTKAAGSPNPTLTASYSGFVNGDTPASLTTAPTLSTTATTNSPAGTYPITVSGAVDPNYSIAYSNGTLTVTNTPLTFAAIPAKTYGAADFDPGASSPSPITYTSSNPAVAAIVNNNIHIVGAGNSVITATAGSNSATQLLIVNPASLTIVANGVTKTYGTALTNGTGSTGTFTPIGLVNGDVVNSVSLTYGTGGLASSPVGTYNSSVTPSAATGSTFNANNYSITYSSSSITVIPVSLTITANNQSKNYGSANPALTLSYSGFVNGDTQASLATPPTVSTTAVTNSPVGSYPINVSGAASANYNISYNNGTLTVGQAALVISADNHAKTYGSVNPALTITYSGFVNGEDQTYLSTLPIISTTATTGSPIGNYPITVSGAVDANYNISYNNGTLNIAPAALTITADNQTKVYGAANPSLTISYNGFVNGDTQASLTTLPTANTTASTSSGAGTYPITVGGAVDPNYSFIYNAGTLTVTPAALTITANNQTKTQGSPNPPLTLSYSGYVNGDNSASLATPPSVSTTAVTSSPVGSYPITVGGAADPDYTISYVQGTLTVTGSSLTFGPIPSKVYGSGDFNPGATSTNSITYSSSNIAVATIVSGNIHIVGAGSSTITANDGTNNLQQTLTVTTAPLTIAANNASKTYGAANPSLSVSYTGFVNSDTQASLTTQPKVSTTALTGSPVGTYPITASGAASNNYSISYSAGTLTIGQTPLTITANNQTMVQGASIPTLTVSYSGFVNSETNTALTTQPAVTTTATSGSPVGTYPITASGAVDANYAISYVQGTLTVTAANTLTFNPIPSQVYGNADFSPGATTTTGSITYTSSNTGVATIVSGNIHIVGVGNSTITASNGTSSLQQTLTVTRAPLTITADNKTKTQGTNNPPLTVSYSGFVNGQTNSVLTTQPTVTTTATKNSPAGTYPITASGAVAANYSISYVQGTLTVTAAGAITFNPIPTKVYGAADFNPGATSNSTGTGTITYTSSNLAVATIVSGNIHITGVGTSTITASNSSSTASQVLTVTPAALSVAANNVNKTYGNTMISGPGSAAFTATGLVYNETIGSVTINYSAGATATDAPGIYSGAITASAATGGTFKTSNYNITYITGTLTVTKAPLTISANNVSKVYGGTLTGGAGSTAFTATGLVNSQTVGSVTISYGNGSATTAAAGTYTGSVVPSAATGGTFMASNYTITYANGNIVVNKAPLTITADNKTKTQGTANPPLTVSYSGFVNGQTNSVLTTQPTVTTTATKNSPAGTYPITASNAAAANYSFTYVQGTLTITNPSHAVIVSVNNPEHVTYIPVDEPVVRQAVSPNGDGINDVLHIDNIESYPDNKVMLMNRNGTTIYEMTGYDNVNKVFDGHSNITKEMQLPGTYFYMIEYKAQDGEVKRKTGYFVIKY